MKVAQELIIKVHELIWAMISNGFPEVLVKHHVIIFYGDI